MPVVRHGRGLGEGLAGPKDVKREEKDFPCSFIKISNSVIFSVRESPICAVNRCGGSGGDRISRAMFRYV